MKTVSILALVTLLGVCDVGFGAPPKKPVPPDKDRLHLTPFGKFQGPRITLKNVKQLKRVAQHNDYVWKMNWSRDGKRVAFVHWEGPVEIRDGRDFRLLRTFTTKRGPIHFTFGSATDTVAYCENDKVAKIHNLSTGKTINLPTGNSQPKVTINLDGSLLATGGYGTAAKLWNASDGKLYKTLETGLTKGGLWPVFNPDEELIAVGNRNSYTTLFDTSTGKKVRVLRKKMTQEIAFSPDGQTLACTYVDASLGLWNVDDGKQKALKKSSAKELYTVAWSPDGRLLATAGLEAKITLWNPRDLSIVRELDAPKWVISVRFTPDGTRLIASGGSNSIRKERKVLLLGVPRGSK